MGRARSISEPLKQLTRSGKAAALTHGEHGHSNDCPHSYVGVDESPAMESVI
jgi:hypothetical protein